MDLRQLKNFVVLAEELNFSRAAVRLHISQPPLSRQVQAIESEIGAPLFERLPKGLALTAAGCTLLDDARRILGMVDAAKDRAGQAGRGEMGRLDVGIFGSAIFHHIPRLLLQFRSLYPQVKISLHEQTKAEQIRALRERRLTIGFNRHVRPEPDLVVEPVYQEPLLVALHGEHPLAQQAAISVRELSAQPLILYPNNTREGFADHVLSLFRMAGLQAQVELQVKDVVTAVALVSSGFGLCVTPEAASSLQLPGVVYRPLKADPPPTVDLVCLYRRGDVSPVLMAFLETVRKFQPESGGKDRVF
ncbi:MULTISPECIES: LysR family transcriptional regulator [Comamonadaceae]|uniref:LysR family transcriptional regulator n=1 Tax=Malikia spinosa TaxID=86180 RepID=A0A7C9IWA2_9BURK|nr:MULTISPECIES: LysR family transcriptional regulator [Comamonadaceae]MDD4941919.1 LysR family transcriptional regulator [Rhodoferax sp.]MDD5480046.1 LysR family transcriptional regulator [Rhodoferax sp.]MYZ50892.1 LysR family transcriptional regulator [Malikia spinosa]